MDKMKRDNFENQKECTIAPLFFEKRLAKRGSCDCMGMDVNSKTFRYNSINNILKSTLLLAIILFIFIIQIPQISSIGITPGRTTLNFEPGLHQEVQFSIVNTEHKDMSVVFFVRGDLNSSITLKQVSAGFLSTDDSKSFSYAVDLPAKIEKPGLYNTEIVAMELPKDLELSGTFVGATVAVVTQLYVYVPYPNKYLEGELSIVPDSSGKTVFLIPIINRGKLDIVNAKAVIDIYTALNEKIATIETNTESASSLERKELAAEWDSSANPGKYLAVATIIYDNEVLKLEKQFNVGEANLEIQEVSVKDFSLGEIAKFEALVENKWSNPLNDVYLNILVYNNEGETMADFKSPNYNIPGLSKAEMVAYWDTAGVRQGTYDGKLMLKYGEKSTDRNIQLKISESDIEISGITGKVLVKGKGKSNVNNLLVILIIVLVVANIIWFVVVKKALKRRK